VQREAGASSSVRLRFATPTRFLRWRSGTRYRRPTPVATLVNEKPVRHKFWKASSESRLPSQRLGSALTPLGDEAANCASGRA
jgi:hypothetical protein